MKSVNLEWAPLVARNISTCVYQHMFCGVQIHVRLRISKYVGPTKSSLHQIKDATN